MSFKLVAQVFDIRLGNPLRKMILIKLADQANDQGYCWPSYETLAWSCEVSRRTVIDHIKWLEDNAFLWVEHRYDFENQKNLSNIYHLTLDKGKQVKPKGSAGAAPVQEMHHEGVVQELHYPSEADAPDLVQELHYPSAGAAPESIIESIIKPINESIKKKPKKLHDIPDDFKPTEKQLEKMIEYGIDIKLTLESFKSTHQSNGKRFKDWNAALTTWINNKIEWGKLVPVSSLPAQQEYEPAFNGWNDRNPDYQQPDAYHPSHDAGKPVVDTRPSPPVTDNWTWKEPLPGMSIPDTDKLIKANRRKGEPTKKTYDRLLAEIQEQI